MIKLKRRRQVAGFAIFSVIGAPAYFAFPNNAIATVTMDFETIAPHALEIVVGPSFSQNGFTVTKTVGSDFRSIGTSNFNYSGSTNLVDPSVNGVTTLTANDGNPFDLISIDLGELNGNSTTVAPFTGVLAGGGTVTQSFTLDGVGFPTGVETFSFDGSFKNLQSVSWVQVSPHHQFDNIVLDQGSSGSGSSSTADVGAMNAVLSNGTFTNPTGETLNLPSGPNLVLGQNGKLINDGAISNNLIVNSSGDIENNGAFKNELVVLMKGNSEFKNSGGASFDNENGVVIVRGQAGFINDGTVTNKAKFNVITDSNQTSTLTNNGVFNNVGGSVKIEEKAILNGTGTFRQTAGVFSAGSFIVDGTVTHTVIIESGTLSGTGTITGDVTIGDGAQFLPGNSPGIFNITGNLIVEDGAVLQLEIGDEINITGFLDVAPTATVEIILGSATAIPANFDIASFFNITNQVASVFEATDIKVFFDGAVDPGTDTIDVFGASTQVAVDNTSNASEFTVLDSAFSVPEPGTFAILGLGLLGMGAARRRKAA